MKKSVVIIIGVVYVLAIALVNFIGVNFKTFDPVVYVESIEIVNEDIRVDEQTGRKSVVITRGEDGVAQYQIKCTLSPADAQANDLKFAFDEQTVGVSVDENGLVTFAAGSSKTVIINVLPLDGSDCQDSVTIIVKNG